MKKNFILKFVLICISLCISLNARTQTTAYQTYLDNGVFSATPAPTGEVRFPAEFEPVQSVMVVYPLNLPWKLLQEISEDCKLVTVVNKRKTSSTIDEIKNEYTNNGVNIDNCEFIIAKNDNLEDGINSHWIRDFGPWCIFNGKKVAIVDNVYNRSFIDDDSNPIADEYLSWGGKPRWRDDAFAKTYATSNNIPLYGMEVVHTGGNMMQDGRGVGVSDLIVHTQSETFAGLSEETVNQRMEDYLGIDPYHVTIDPQGDYIAHVDCWGKFLAPDKIIIARVPSTHEQYDEYEEVAEYFESKNCCWGYPYKVYRVEVPVTKKSEIKAYNKIAPYTNSLILNNKVLVPISSLTPSSYNDAALAVYREAMPGYEIIGIDYIIEDAEMGNYSGWKNTDALHCRTRDIMDFKMLFVDHRNVLFGEQAYKESYPITAKFIAYSGDNITETKLHYSINGGEYTTVDMQQVGTTDEYTGNITGVKTGDVVRYYITGKDNSNRICAQPQFCGENSQYNNSESHTFTVGVASEEDNEGEEPEQPTTPEPEQPAQPTLDITKYYRIKTTIGTNDQYLTIFDNNEHPSGPNGGVGVAMLDEDNAGQMFKFENAGEGKYYLISADGYYIYCQSWNVDAINSKKSALWGFDSENGFNLQCDKGYFKVENVSGTNYVFCNVEKETRATTIATWSLEEVPVSVTISADNNSVTVNESVKLNATAIGGTGNYTYSWSPATSFADATIANPTFTPNTTGEYTFTCTVTDNGVTATSESITITVNEVQQGGDDNTGGDTSGDVVTIDGSGNGSTYVPIYNNENFAITQQIYTKNEIDKNDGGTITSIAFKTASDNNVQYPYTRTIDVYMANIDDSNFGATSSGGKAMKALSNENLVFSGNITFDEKDKWIVIDLTSDFSYNGSKNLLVCVNDYTDDYVTSSKCGKFATFTSFEDLGDNGYAYRALYKGNHNTDGKYNPNNSITSCKASEEVPFIQLTFGDAGEIQPTKPTISVVDNKTRFTADNSDYVKFTVTPEDAEIWYTSGTQEIKLTTTDKSFKTSTAGTYSFYAKKDGVDSDPITVEAVAEKELTLTLSKNSIVANGIEEVTFTVKQVDINGTEQDVTNNCTFKINGTAITGNTFFTNRAGEYTVTATKNSKETSAQITATAVSGEENVVLIDGNVMQPADQSYNYSLTNPLSVPVNNYYSYSISQQYYTKGEIGKDEGVITHIAFKTAKTAGTYTRDIEVYMVNADESTFSSKELKQMSGTNIVYSGSVQFSSNSWITLPLSSSFKYTGKNVLICVNDKTDTKETSLTSHFDAYALGSNDDRVVYMHSDNMLDPTAANTGNTFVYFAPFVKFTFEQELPIVLEGSKQIVKADGSDIIRFSVKQGGNYVTGKTKIYVEQYEGSTIISTTVLNDTTFATSNVGTYRAYAKKDDLTSNNVEFTSVYPIVLTADKTTIIADGKDAVTFTLMQNDIDVTTAKGTVIYVGNNVITNTFATSTMGTYMAYATRDGIRSNGIEITVNDKNYDGSEGVAGGSENEYYNGDGSITYNKGEENEYTLIAKKINNTTAYIKQDNVKVNATGDYYWRFDQNKPHAETILTIPEKILFGDEWITITKIEDFAFSDKCDLSEDGRQVFEPGNPLNSNFTGVIIPSTITEIGTYTFGFTIEEYVICFAKTPPALSETTVNNPFYKNTYDNVILYVPAESIDDYRNALGWGKPFMGGDEYYFKNIYPITMPTYVEKEKDNLIWDNENNWRTYVKIDDDKYEERYGVMPEEGVDVLIDGNVRITNGCEANVGAVHIITGSITIADGGQLIHTNAGVNVTLEKEIIGYHESTSPTSWYTISSPLFNSVKASSVINLLENDYDLYRYDEPTHYWDNIEDPEGLGGGPVGDWETLDAGRGYLYANQENVTLKFKGVANHIGGTYNLTRDVWDGVLIGFHLVGNPFTHNIYMNNAFDTEATLADGYYILSNTGAWGANLGSNTPIEPCQGVLIKAMTEGTLTINKKVGPATEAQTRSRSKDEFIAISVANKNYEDKAYVSFNAENPLEKVNHQNKDIPMVYIPMEEDNYAIATMDKDVKEIPVAFEAKTMGQYTIAATAENCEFKNMYLVDRLTGIETNLLLESYTFMATTTDNSKRFIIKLSNNDLDTENFIFINNNEMIINNIEGKGVLQIFDVMGRYISHTEVSGSANISTEAFTSGVYIIRMTDDNGVKTQKVVLY